MSRADQGLPPIVRDREALRRVAALILEIRRRAQAAKVARDAA